MAEQSFQEKIARKFPPTYRQEIMPRIMEAITKGESCFLVGMSGVGKSNLFRFIKSDEIEERYLSQDSSRFGFIWADTNALAGDLTAFHLYELILYNLLKWVEENAPANVSLAYLQELHEKVVVSDNRTLAQRYVETALRYLYSKIDEMRIVLLFDEFEPIAQTLDFQFFRSLRWLRDEFKYHLVYVMAAHRSPMAIRREMFVQGEAFYELLAPNILALSLYTPEDTNFAISELSSRYATDLTENKKEIIHHLSGGHAGLISAIFRVLFKHSLPHDENWQIGQLLSYDSVAGECRKIWNSLDTTEQDTIITILKQNFTPKLPLPLSDLIAKGVLSKAHTDRIEFFSPLFETFLATFLKPMLEEEEEADL